MRRMLIVVLAFATSGVLSGCASDPTVARRNAAPVGISHTCTPAQRASVAAFADRFHRDVQRALEDAVLPQQAAAEHLSGRVTIAVGYADGQRQHVGLSGSSGYAVLDNDALKLVRQAAPQQAPDLPCDAATLRLAIRYGEDRGRWPVRNAAVPRSTFATPVW